MPTLLQNDARKRDTHESLIRSTVDFAREVRIHLRDAQVIFGTVRGRANPDAGSFRIRPWGFTESIDIRFDDVALASTVKEMGWQRHCAIAAAQQAGIFTSARKSSK
jgi:hypothetical protein